MSRTYLFELLIDESRRRRRRARNRLIAFAILALVLSLACVDFVEHF